MSSAIKYYITILLLLFVVVRSVSQNHKTSKDQNTIKFTENKNQWSKNILFRAQLDGGALFLEKNAFTYNFYDKETLRENHLAKGKNVMSEPISQDAFKMLFLNSLSTVQT